METLQFEKYAQLVWINLLCKKWILRQNEQTMIDIYESSVAAMKIRTNKSELQTTHGLVDVYASIPMVLKMQCVKSV